MGLLLGSAAQAAVVKDDQVATGIKNLGVDGTLYNVEFKNTSWSGVYGDPPTFDFDSVDSSAAAVDAVNAALNADGASLVGESSTEGAPAFMIGFGSFESSIEGEIVLWQAGAYSTPDPDAWISDLANNPFAGSATDNQPLMWADFRPVPVPAAVWLFGSGLVGLVGVARRKKTA
jgi:hypothetical protein